ncbi:MAG: metallophosphoesterase [Planctomycetaceae bacterium]
MRRIAHLSDLHFGTEDRQVAAGLLAELERQSPQLVVVSGDLTQRARRSQFVAAHDYLDQIAAPKLIVPGNHDLPLYNVWDRLLHPLANYRRFITDEMHPFFRDDEMAVAGINTARSNQWKEGRISLAQMDTLQKQFSEVPDDILKVLVCHHPFIPPGEGVETYLVGRAPLALKMLESSGCALILSGHLHHAYYGDVRAHHLTVTRFILVAQAGTAISNRRRDEPNAYNLITLDGDRLQLEVRTWEGSRFATTVQSQYVRCETGWAALPT